MGAGGSRGETRDTAVGLFPFDLFSHPDHFIWFLWTLIRGCCLVATDSSVNETKGKGTSTSPNQREALALRVEFPHEPFLNRCETLDFEPLILSSRGIS